MAPIDWINEPGIAARACDKMPKKYVKITEKKDENKLQKEYIITRKAANKLDLDKD